MSVEISAALEKLDAVIEVQHQRVRLAHCLQGWTLKQSAEGTKLFLPRSSVNLQYLIPSNRVDLGDDTGLYIYFDLLIDGVTTPNAAAMLTSPTPGYRAINDHFSFCPHVIERCLINGVAAARGSVSCAEGWMMPDGCQIGRAA